MSDSPEAKVKEIIINELGVESDKVTPDASFVEDLGADSLDTVELVMAFEEEFGIDIPDEDAEQSFARAHFEQHMRVTGWLEIDGERISIDGFGLRDHSWGPRSWQSIHQYEWLTLNFGEDLGAMVSIIQRDAEGKQRSAGGVIVRGDEMERIVEAEIDAEYEDNGLYHKRVTARVKTEGGEEHTIEGTVKSFIPLRNRREGKVTHIGEGMTEWKLGDRTGYGLSEFLRQVE